MGQVGPQLVEQVGLEERPQGSREGPRAKPRRPVLGAAVETPAEPPRSSADMPEICRRCCVERDPVPKRAKACRCRSPSAFSCRSLGRQLSCGEHGRAYTLRLARRAAFAPPFRARRSSLARASARRVAVPGGTRCKSIETGSVRGCQGASECTRRAGHDEDGDPPGRGRPGGPG